MSEEGRRTGLGRGLSALFDSGDEAGGDAIDERNVRSVPIEHLQPGRFQPRHRFDESSLTELVDSIRARGMLQPILVRPVQDRPGRYEIVAGERRWRAAQQARLHEVPVVVRGLADSEALEAALIENVQRQDLTALEEAEGYRRLLDEFGHTQDKLGQLVGKSRSHVANMMRLLNLPEPVRDMLQDGRLSAGHGRALLAVADPAAVARDVVARGLNVRETEKLAQRGSDGGTAGTGRRASSGGGGQDADTRALERDIAEALGLSVSLTHRDGRGEVRIAYRTLEQLDEISRRLMAGRRVAD